MGRIADMPTRRLDAAELAKFARQADETVRSGKTPDPESSAEVARSSAPELEVGVDVDVDLDGLDGQLLKLEERMTAPPPEGGLKLDNLEDLAQHPSEVRLTATTTRTTRTTRTTQESSDARVPVIIASRDNLSWFALEDGAETLLGLIDGLSTMDDIVERSGLPREAALRLFGELEAHQVITFE